MTDMNSTAILAKDDKIKFEAFIKENESFILRVASKVSKKYITKECDEWSVALSAFCEAVKSYTVGKGGFSGFCELVIKRRLYDYNKKELKHSSDLSIDPINFDCENIDDETPAADYKIIAKLSTFNDDSAKLEIEALQGILKQYEISFFDLAFVSPKAEKTKKSCARAVIAILKTPALLKDLRSARLLPIKKVSKISDVPQKILERHRKYIIAGVEILDGDFPIISEYISFIRKEL